MSFDLNHLELSQSKFSKRNFRYYWLKSLVRLVGIRHSFTERSASYHSQFTIAVYRARFTTATNIFIARSDRIVSDVTTFHLLRTVCFSSDGFVFFSGNLYGNLIKSNARARLLSQLLLPETLNLRNPLFVLFLGRLLRE